MQKWFWLYMILAVAPLCLQGQRVSWHVLRPVRLEYEYGYCDARGHIKFKLSCRNAQRFPPDAVPFRKAVAPVEGEENGFYPWAFINTHGERVSGYLYSNVFELDKCYLVTRRDSVALCDFFGNRITAFDYRRVGWNFVPGDHIALRYRGRVGALDHSGKQLVPFVYDTLVAASEKLVVYHRNDTGFLYNLSGRLLAVSAGRIQLLDNIAIVGRDSLWGCIRSDSSWLLPLARQHLSLFKYTPYLLACKDEHTPGQQLYDTTGRLLASTAYYFEDILSVDSPGQFVVRTAPFYEGLCGVQNQRGEWNIPPVYQSIATATYLPDYLGVRDSLYRYGMIHASGREIIPCRFSQPFYVIDDQFRYLLAAYKEQNVVTDSLGRILFAVPGHLGTGDAGYPHYRHGLFVFTDFVQHHHYDEVVKWAFYADGRPLVPRDSNLHSIEVSAHGLLLRNRKRFDMTQRIMDTTGTFLPDYPWEGLAFSNQLGGGEILVCRNCSGKSETRDGYRYVFYEGGRAAILCSRDSVLVPRITQCRWNKLLLLLMRHQQYTYEMSVTTVNEFRISPQWERRQLKRMRRMSIGDFLRKGGKRNRPGEL